MQPAAPSGSEADLLVWGGVLIALLITMWLVWMLLRRWCFGNSRESFPDGLWTIEDLRRLRDSGELSESEYQALRRQAIAPYQDTNDKAVPK